MRARLLLVVVTLVTAALHLPWWAILLADLLAYAIWAYTHPYRRCPRCKGTGTNPGSSGKRWGKCRRCKGHREVKTFGAQLLHRAARSAVAYRRNRKDS